MRNYITGAVNTVFNEIAGTYSSVFEDDFKQILIEEYVARAQKKWDNGRLGNPHSILHDVAYDVLFNSREESRNWIFDLINREDDEDYAFQYCSYAVQILEEITPRISAYREVWAELESAELELQNKEESERVNFIGDTNVKANVRRFIRALDNRGQFRVYKAVTEYVLDGLIPDMDCWRDCDKEAWELIQEGIERGPYFVGK